jgi:hypothetical protein
VSFNEFFVNGLRDAERRLPLLRPIRPSDQQEIETIVRASWLFRVVDGAVDRLAHAWNNSVAVGAVQRAWIGLELAEKRLLVGLVLVVAALVHVGLVWWHEVPPSWLWLILPALAAALGVVFLMFASVARKAHG